MLGVFGTAAVTLVCVMAVRQYKHEYAAAAEMAGVVLMLGAIIPQLTGSFAEISGYADALSMSGEYFSMLCRVIVVTVATQLGCEACRDAGNGLLACAVELAGRLAVLLISMPLIKVIINIAVSMTEG